MIINACDMSNGGSKVAGESKVLLTGLIYRAWQIVKGMAVLPNSRFAKLPSPAIDLKIWKALYSHGWLFVWA